MMYTGECEIVRNYHWTEPRARKAHKCCECSATIEVGEKHFSASGVLGRDFLSFRQHLLCCEAAMLVRDELRDGECIPFGELKGYCDEFRVDHRYAARMGDEPCRKLRALLAKIKCRERKENR